MPKTKIFYLISSLTQGGAERHLVDLLRGLDPDRFEGEICVLRGDNHFAAELPPDQPRYRLRSRLWAAPTAFARLVASLHRAQPAILHTYLTDGNLWGRLATALGRRPRVITSVHIDQLPPVARWLERNLASRSDRIVAHSRSIERMLIDRLGIDAGRVALIPNGVDPARFPAATPEARRTARAEQGLARDALVALMPARITPQKNQALVVAAMAKLKAEGALPPEMRLLLAGRISSAGYHRQVAAAIRAAGLEGQVRFLGAVRDMKSLYAAADVVLMPSVTEASPIAALEALASEVPVLISANANTDEVLVDGRGGWQIGEPTVDSVAAAIAAIAARPAVSRWEMGVAARAHVLEHFTTRRVATDFMRLYDTVAPATA